MKIVSAGSSFCLVPDTPLQSPNDDIKNGRKSPFISSRAWPKALRTRSASKERISSRHRYLQGPIEQIKEFQEKKVSSSQSQQFSRNLSDSEDIVNRGQETCKNDFVTRSQSIHNIAASSRPSPATDRTGISHKGILKKPTAHVPRVTERISNYQQNIQETNSKHQATLPWNTKVCRKDSEAPPIRRAASSPCLFVKQSCVNIKTRKTPIKLFGTITSMGNLIEERLSNVLGKDPNHCINDENVTSFMSETSGNSPDKSQAASQDDASRIYQSALTEAQAPKSENNNIPSIAPTLQAFSGLNTNQNFSNSIQNPGKNVQLAPTVTNLHTWMRNDHSAEAARTLPTPSSIMRNRSGTEPREESASLKSVSSVSSRPPRSSLSPHHLFRGDEAKLEKINSERLRFYERSPPALDPTCDPFYRRGDKNSMTSGVAEKGERGSLRGENVIRESEEMSVRQRICNNPEHFNSSEDEEIQKELSSILTNGQGETDTKSVHRPRFLTNPMKYESNHGSKTFSNYAQSELTDTTSSDIEIASTEKLFADPNTAPVRGNRISNSNDSKIQLAGRNNSGESDLNNNLSGAAKVPAESDGKVIAVSAPASEQSASNAIFISQGASAAAAGERSGSGCMSVKCKVCTFVLEALSVIFPRLCVYFLFPSLKSDLDSSISRQVSREG